MSPTPNGRLFGDDLVLTRTFRAPMADVWASLTDPARTARWFGPWEGDAAPGRTELRFTHHLTGTDGVGEVGPGWEYYLDALVASRDGQPAPDFTDYYPEMKQHFEAQR